MSKLVTVTKHAITVKLGSERWMTAIKVTALPRFTTEASSLCLWPQPHRFLKVEWSFILSLTVPVPATARVEDWLWRSVPAALPSAWRWYTVRFSLIILLALRHGIYLCSDEASPVSLLISFCLFQPHLAVAPVQQEVALSLKWINALMEVARAGEGMWEACDWWN